MQIEVGPQRPQLASAAQRTRPDHGTLAQIRQTRHGTSTRRGNNHIAGVGPFGERRQSQPIGDERRQVFGAMDTEINLIGEEGLLQLLHKQALIANRREGHIKNPVALGANDL